MLDPSYIRENLDEVSVRLASRHSGVDLTPLVRLDEKRRSLIREVEVLKRRRNEANTLITGRKKAGEDTSEIIADMRGLAERIKEYDEQLGRIQSEVTDLLMGLPNLPHESVPAGRGEEDNIVERTWGEKPTFTFQPRAHWELGEALGIIDFKRAARLAGARFAVMMGAGARLERALIDFMLDVQTREHGYTEVFPPLIANTRTMTGTGQLPKFAGDLFRIEGTDLWLVPTAEVPLTNLHARETLDEEMLPLRYTAYTACFRSEAGSYGKDVRGLMRQHQFNKVELVAVTTPESSYEELGRLTGHAEEILRRLGLPYRVVTLCTADLGAAAAKTFDLEVWLPSENRYREISSCSNCEAYQARRAGIRIKRRGKKGTELAHTLNGSGLAVGRTVIALLENYQEADGSVVIPPVLRPYMDGRDRIA
ncbi:MAG: serine--tRNA ligase [Acidobacteriota bacterium]